MLRLQAEQRFLSRDQMHTIVESACRPNSMVRIDAEGLGMGYRCEAHTTSPSLCIGHR